ncbi:1-acyl-sn-glycerol-3-phosphate acyltransferase [Fusobacterium perfoetens]|uniref:lysophospholipid acyltransferase family protein n=1 Tax=Fusobacterium perfoetens TaxID=852 RepID=UPI001F1B9115|nr:lysophospholipid acyltransferase family protein [Fusobacterium perfoetens]MCF2625820.1 1-acyl-sn-glycerol-3-phosphate acyltransferase [Fusobacterium perfoetens]
MFGIILATVSAVCLFIYKEITFIPAHFYKNKKKKTFTARKNLRDISCCFLKVLGTKVEVVYKDKEAFEHLNREKGIVLIANHQSNFDIPVILSGIKFDLGFVAKKEMESWPFFHRWMRRGKYIFLDRSNPREGIKSIKKAVKIVKEGYPTVIFPEGERSLTGEIGNFKKGSFKLALDTNGIIVPMTICGAINIQKRGSIAVSRNRKVKLIVEKPIDISILSDEEKKNLNNIVRDKIIENYNN